jgi:phosphonoacetaldehyde hydrolase
MKHLKVVIFDWAGTVVDYGSLAPMGAFVSAFRSFGLDVAVAEARGPMGMAKRPHIAAIFALPRVASEWSKQHGRPATDADIDALYDVFVPMNVASAAEHAALIPGTAETVRRLRERGLKIGSTTGYTREIMARILPLAAAQGFAPDNLVCTGDTREGRPTPFMIYKTLLDLAVWPAWSAVKVDDTQVGVAEGVNAGAWTIGVSVSGNVFGLSLEETRRLAPRDFEQMKAEAVAKLTAAGAHYVIDSVADLLPAIESIERRLAGGEKP